MTTIQEAKELIKDADLVLIGAGAGLSAAAGLTYSGSRFQVLFKNYVARYGMTDMYSAGFYPFPSLEGSGATGPSISTTTVIRAKRSPFIKSSLRWLRIRIILS